MRSLLSLAILPLLIGCGDSRLDHLSGPPGPLPVGLVAIVTLETPSVIAERGRAFTAVREGETVLAYQQNCMVTLPNDAEAPLMGALVRHEMRHCSGLATWPGHNEGAR